MSEEELKRLKSDCFLLLDAWWEQYEEGHHGPIYPEWIIGEVFLNEPGISPQMKEWIQEWAKQEEGRR